MVTNTFKKNPMPCKSSLGDILNPEFLRMLRSETPPDDLLTNRFIQSILLVIILGEHTNQKQPFIELLVTCGLDRNSHSHQQLQLFMEEFAGPNEALYLHLVLYAKEHVKIGGKTYSADARTDARSNVVQTFVLLYWRTFIPSHCNVDASITTLSDLCILLGVFTMTPVGFRLCMGFPGVFVHTRGIVEQKLSVCSTEEEKEEENKDLLDNITQICKRLEIGGM
jgi:hypothetical protein